MTAPADNTPLSIITDAYVDAGLIELGATIGPEQLVAGMRKLTGMINLWQTQGLKLWLNVETSVTLVASQGTYALKPAGDVDMTKPLRVITAIYVDSNNIRRPLVPLAWDDYMRLSQITQTGAVNSYFVNKKQSELSVFFWLIPDSTAATGTAKLLLQVQVTNFINVTETMNFPIEWRLALEWGLSDEICTGQPQAIMDRCELRANQHRIALENWDVEDAPTRITPDQRMNAGYGRFR